LLTLVEARTTSVCGDGAVNQLPNSYFLLGEECDGADDSACPGNCFPPGDTFQCTCAGNDKRVRFQANGFAADLDNGWTGTSHNSGVTDKAGFITTYSNCDCNEMTGSTCTGTTGDSLCDVAGQQKPTCSWDPFGALTCEQHGGDTDDTVNGDDDCQICDQFSVNAGDWCNNESACTGQCYPLAGGGPTMPCPDGQVDCPSGQICRGQCDRTPKCLIIPNGAPLPISSGGTAVCILTTFREDIFGTQDIVLASMRCSSAVLQVPGVSNVTPPTVAAKSAL
jgi:hypothetical protein